MRFRNGAGGEPRIQRALLGAYARMLGSDHDATRMAALHGIGHLEDAQGAGVIRAFLEAHPGLDPHLRAYAERAMTGDVL